MLQINNFANHVKMRVTTLITNLIKFEGRDRELLEYLNY